MAAARAETLALGSELLLMVEKTTGTFVAAGCLESATYNNPGRELITVECRDGRTIRASGRTPQVTIQVEGYTKFYATGDQASNFSAVDAEALANDGTAKTFKLTGIYAGDPVWTLTNARITDFSLTSPENEASKYSFTITAETRTVGTVPSGA